MTWHAELEGNAEHVKSKSINRRTTTFVMHVDSVNVCVHWVVDPSHCYFALLFLIIVYCNSSSIHRNIVPIVKFSAFTVHLINCVLVDC